MITFAKAFVSMGLLVLLVAWIAGCAPAPAAMHRSVAPSGPGIGIGITSATCPDIVVQAGNYIAWTNLDTVPHVVLHKPQEGDPDFSSGTLEPGEGFEVRFMEPGVFHYQCTDGDTELGVITVQP